MERLVSRLPLDAAAEAELSTELCTALTAGGFTVEDVQISWVLPNGADAAEGFGVVPSVKDAAVIVDTELDDRIARAVLGFACAWFRARRRHRADDVEFVSVRTPGERALVQVQIGRCLEQGT